LHLHDNLSIFLWWVAWGSRKCLVHF
jgi:hypothetical protein